MAGVVATVVAATAKTMAMMGLSATRRGIVSEHAMVCEGCAAAIWLGSLGSVVATP